MLYRVWPAMLSLVLPWGPHHCTYGGGDGSAGESGSSLAGGAGASSGSGGAGASSAGDGALGGAGLAAGGSAGLPGVDNGGTSGAAVDNGGTSGAAADNGGTSGTAVDNGGAGTSSGGSELAGTTGVAGASAGSAGTGGAQQGSFTLAMLPSPLSVFGTCHFDDFPASNALLMVINTSNVPLTWRVSGDSAVVIDPASSTLAPGQSVTARVSLTTPTGPGLPRHVQTVISIDADIAPSQTISVTGDLSGKYLYAVPPDIDYGEVAVVPPFTPPPPAQSSNSRFIAADGNITAQVLGSTNPAFSVEGAGTVTMVPGLGYGWLLVFRPQTAGPQEATITLWSYMNTVCPPNTFNVRGVGVTP